MNTKKEEALEIFYDHMRRMPTREDAKNCVYVRKLAQYQKTAIYKCNMQDLKDMLKALGGSLSVRVEEIPEDLNFHDIIIALMEFGLQDDDFFDMEDTDTIKYIQEVKEKCGWKKEVPLTESATYPIGLCF